MKTKYHHFLFSTILLSSLTITSPIPAQISSDGTTGTIVTPGGCTVCEISGGMSSPSGINLFHSFDQFSLPNNSYKAVFKHNNPVIQNIIARVTGSTISNINGEIKYEIGTPDFNLFLINPNGITFGPTAQLNLNGSFTATTADSITFGPNLEFSATNPQAPPLLTIQVPIGLQFGSNPAPVAVEASVFSPFLGVPQGQTLALVGGDLNLIGGSLNSFEGRVELGSVGAGSLVDIEQLDQGFALDYQGVNSYQDINLSSGAIASVLGGDMQVRGRNITLQDTFSSLAANPSSTNDGGTLEVVASESVNIIGDSSGRSVGFFSQTFGPQNAGNINVTAKNLRMSKGGLIYSTTLGDGNAGEVTLNIMDTIELTSLGSDSSTGIFPESFFFAQGNGGPITVNTGQLILREGALISTSTASSGRGGDITVNATQGIRVEGMDSLISTETFGDGTAGNITLNTPQLIVMDQGEIIATTSGMGQAGKFVIMADSVLLSNQGKISAETESAGNAGKIEIKSGNITIDNAELTTRSQGPGKAGEINVKADSLFVQNQGRLSAEAENTGDSGSIRQEVKGEVKIRDGGSVSVRSLGNSNAGDLTIFADSISLYNQGKIAATTAGGEGGNIKLQTIGSIILRFNSEITTEAMNNGNGGNIIIVAGGVVVAFLPENSDVVANAFQGKGGNIFATAKGVFGFRQFEQQRTSESDFIASSALGIDGITDINTEDNFRFELPDDFVNADISRACQQSRNGNQSEFIIVGSGGIPSSPEQPFTSDAVEVGLVEPVIGAAKNQSLVNPSPIPDPPLEIVQAQGWVKENGKIKLVANMPQVFWGGGSRGCGE